MATYWAVSSFWCFWDLAYNLTGKDSTISLGAGTDPSEDMEGREDNTTDCWWISSRTWLYSMKNSAYKDLNKKGEKKWRINSTKLTVYYLK